jgi:TolB-like protein/tetratricopeptide (TPR) repeat protein
MSGEAPESGGGQQPPDPPASAQVPASIHVFISYASQDVTVADAIVGALERDGLKCWIAPRDVMPGEFYADAIVRAIDAAEVFVLVLSQNAAASPHVVRELERATSKRHPVVSFRIDLTSMPPALEYFLNTSHWLDTSASGVIPALPKLVDAVQRLVVPITRPSRQAGAVVSKPAKLTAEPGETARVAAPARALTRGTRLKLLGVAALVVSALVAGVYLFHSRGESRREVVISAEQSAGESTRPASPPRSVAVLAFVNLSGDTKDDYLADGLSEELVNALARIPQLSVAARTSSFSFKGLSDDVRAIGRKLNVGSVLEGSVRKAGSRVRVTAQLINAATGFHLWSHTYDRELKDVLVLQTEIATTVAGTLQVTLLADAKHKLFAGGTANPQAYDAYLRGRYGESIQDERSLRAALAALDEAVQLDPSYANALAFRADVIDQLANVWVKDPNERQRFNLEARSSAEEAVALSGDSGLAHFVLGRVLSSSTDDYARIDAEYRRSIELEPGNAQLLRSYASYAAQFGRADALAAAERSVSLDPFSLGAHANLGVVLFYARRHDAARAAFLEAASLGTNRLTVNWTGENELAAGKPSAALQYCPDRDFAYDQACLAMAYHKLNRKTEAAALLEKLKKEQGDGGAYVYAEIYAYWGQPREALAWLSKAAKLKDSGLLAIKTDPFLDSIRNLAEFKEIVNKLDLPT